MRPPFLKQRPRPTGGAPRDSGTWLWYVLGALTALWLVYSWVADK